MCFTLIIHVYSCVCVAGWSHGAVAGWKGPNLSQTPDLVPFYQQLRRVCEHRRISSSGFLEVSSGTFTLQHLINHMSNVLFAVRIIYDSGSRRRPSTSWSSFWTMTQSPWMCRYVLPLVCPSRIISPPPVQLFIRVNIRDGSSCCVTQTLQCSELSLINHHRPELDFHTTFTKWSNHIYTLICLVGPI